MNHRREEELRVGIVGCGHVAEYHARFLRTLPGVKLVGIADVQTEAAQRFAQQHGVLTVGHSVANLLDSTRLDVLHVTTPPAFHYASALAALERKVHVFLEKPMAFTVGEVTHLYEQAGKAGLCLCPDFINLFHPRMQQVLQSIGSGELGRAVHVDAEMCLDLGLELREAEGLHWSHRLPGGLLRDYASHLLYLALYFTGWPVDLQVSRKATGTLPQGVLDHLAVQVNGERCTASVLLSCLSRRSSYRVRVFCENGFAEVDFESQTALIKPRSGWPRKVSLALGNFATSFSLSSQATANITNFIRGKLVPYAGLQTLLPRFYDSIRAGSPPPVSRELATAVTVAEEKIFADATPSLIARGLYAPSVQAGVRRSERVLVTGASGYVGQQVVQALVKDGFWVRAMARPTSPLERLKQLGVEIFLGDIRSPEDMKDAAQGMQAIIHLAAGIQGSLQTIVDTCERGAQNVAKAAIQQGARRVIYMSSLSVYDLAKLRSGQQISSDSLLEEKPEQRGAYSLGKRLAEDVALAQLSHPLPAWTIVRPSLIVGGGRDLLAPLGPKLGNTVICMSSRRKRLALVHVSDVAEAMVQILQHENTAGKVYLLSHPEDLTVGQYIRNCVRRSAVKGAHVAYVPYIVSRSAMLMAALVRKATGFGPRLSKRQLLSMYRGYSCVSAELLADTGWQPCGSLLDRLVREKDNRSAGPPTTSQAATVQEAEYAEASVHVRR